MRLRTGDTTENIWSTSRTPHFWCRAISTCPVCFPTSEAAVFPLHTRNGGANYGNSEDRLSQGGRSLHICPEGRRHEESRHDYLRGRMDTACIRHADYSDRGDSATRAG